MQYLSWFFDTTAQTALTYGLTVWRKCDDRLCFELIHKESDQVSVYDVRETILNHSLTASLVTHLFEQSAEMEAIVSQLKQTRRLINVDIVLREGTIREQVLVSTSLL